MGEAGDRLREARTRRGLELADVAERLRVPPKTLRALEWDRSDLLPPDEAARALNAYEAFLGFSPEPLAKGAPRSRRRRLLTATAALSVVAGIGVAIVFATLSAGGDGAPKASARAAPVPAAPPPVAKAETPPPPASAPPADLTLVLRATRGDSWVDARSGSVTGRPLYQATLVQGDFVRLRAARIWLRLGAAGNVDVTANGKKIGPLVGTVEVVLAPRDRA